MVGLKYILALDQGTSSSKAFVFDQRGNILASAQKEFTQYFPSPGLVEHDPEEIWSSQFSASHEAIAKAKIHPSQIACIGITNQRETTILWDRKTGVPIHKALVWQDRRTFPLCQDLIQKGLEPLFRQKTGLLLDPYFSGTKIKWLLDNVEGARDLAKRGDLLFGTVDTWLLWNLTGKKEHMTDATNASRTLLYNIYERKWDEELLSILEIPPQILPQVRNSSEVYGSTAKHLFSVPIPIGAIAGDQQAALFGQGCISRGDLKVTYGTGCFILQNIGDTPLLSQHRLLTTIASQINDKVQYALEGSVFIAGAAIQWFRDQLGVIRTSSEMDILAQKVKTSGGVYFVPAFTGLGAPYWDPSAKGAILGLSRNTNLSHLARACLESIAFQASEVLQLMAQDSNLPFKEIKVDGGVDASDLVMQLQADLTHKTVLRPKNPHLTALGIAFLAGLSVGMWKDPKELLDLWKLDQKFIPQMNEEVRNHQLGMWKQAVQRTLNWRSDP